MPEELQGLSLFHPIGNLAQPTNPFGKDIANAGLFRALIEHGGFSEIAVLNQAGLTNDQLAAQLPKHPSIRFISANITETAYPSHHGLLIRGQPYLAELAWLRRAAGLDQAYSLVGLIHTIAPPTIRQMIGATALAPTHPWDALVCTSPAVKRAMEDMFDGWAEHLAARLGAVKTPRPQLPLVPLAVDTELIAKQANDKQARATLRQRLNILEDEVLVIWVGRLSFYEKAFPQSMLQAMQLAAKDSQTRLHFGLVGWFPGGDSEFQLYKEAANKLAQDLNVIILDGNDPDLVAMSWAAADIFISLVDNIQETFGLTPVEAMAAGLPVVASDWDGYRYTIRNEIDGMLIPTLGSPGGAPGELLSKLHSLELETYQTYVGATAQHTAVHVKKAAVAIAELANNPVQRKAMGLSGQQRAKALFSWPKVIEQYKDLFQDLAEQRRYSDADIATAGCRLDPLRGEPFADFKHFATQTLQSEHLIRISDGACSNDLIQRLQVNLNTLYPGLRGTNAEAMRIMHMLETFDGKEALVKDILKGFPKERQPYIQTTIVWLAKQDLVDWIPASAT